jgi:hypothetical protein
MAICQAFVCCSRPGKVGEVGIASEDGDDQNGSLGDSDSPPGGPTAFDSLARPIGIAQIQAPRRRARYRPIAKMDFTTDSETARTMGR